MKEILQKTKNENGQAMVIFALMITVVFGFAALAVDIGLNKSTIADFQSVVDAAALAGAQRLPNVARAKDNAFGIGVMNGAKTEELEVLTPIEGDISQLKVKGTKTIPYGFAKVFGFKSGTIQVEATAQKTDIANIFKYTIFSDSDTTINGSGFSVSGSIHCNNSLLMNGSNNAIVDGNITTGGSLGVNGPGLSVTGECQGNPVTISSVNVGSINQNPAPHVDTIDMSETLRNKSQALGTYFGMGRTLLNETIPLNDAMYIYGALHLTDCTFSGTGTIAVLGNIDLYGNTNTLPDSSVVLYSIEGSIRVMDTNTLTQATLYAPMGDISLQKSQRIEGRVIGKSLTFNGSGTTIVSSDKDLYGLPTSFVKLIK